MKSNFQMMVEMKDWFPKERGFLNGEEVAYVETTLGIKGRSRIDMQNLRDFAVMMLSHEASRMPLVSKEDFEANRKMHDKISAITCVIDNAMYYMEDQRDVLSYSF